MTRTNRTIALTAAAAVIAAAAVGVVSLRAVAEETPVAPQVDAAQVLPLDEAGARSFVADFMVTRAITPEGQYRSATGAPSGADAFLSDEAKAAYEAGLTQGGFALALYPNGPGEAWYFEIVSISTTPTGSHEVLVRIQKHWEDGEQGVHTERLIVGLGERHTGEPATVVLRAELSPAN
jgi:hypothetical protein